MPGVPDAEHVVGHLERPGVHQRQVAVSDLEIPKFHLLVHTQKKYIFEKKRAGSNQREKIR